VVSYIVELRRPEIFRELFGEEDILA